ncbi:Ubx domain-containing protein [Dimargaris cristalligena]|uniref:UBX domain-containing protein n=1 Tax=Dimargaris cristalligena TaxID=215637 RepID=A0A4P9ZU71_9FUNG|nr:Ubx domain-containing protein [Dimargaris cristalligena]RKP36778.1 UBX domain-containing protein [Dimargaris cristalligena]|eukprot:RKP36778.1 UBX domain-containing protein [Dimargaris cristalligena]
MPPSAAPGQESLVFSFLAWPWRLSYRILNVILGIMAGFIAKDRGMVTHGEDSVEDSPRLQASRFISEFEREYGESRPQFLEKAYSQAIEQAKREMKCLLVVLVSPEHDDTAEFSRRLTNENFLTFLVQHDILVWGGCARYKDAYEVSCTLQASRYPFLAVVAPRSRNGSVRMSVVERIEGLLPIDQVMAQILAKVQEVNDALASLRRAREEREGARLLREQQDQAYMESLRADQEKERKLREKREAEERRQLEMQRLKEEKARLQELKQQYRQYIASHLASEPGPDEKNVARFGIRFPDGQRITRKFRATETLKDVYDFVEVRRADDLDESTSALPPPADYQHAYDFILVSPMPRQEFKERGLTIQEAFKDHWPSTTLIVEEIDEDE